MENKPREIHIFETGFHDGNGNSEAILFDEPGENYIHVIEYSAYDELEAELKRTNLLAGTLIKLKSELTEEVEQLKDENKTLRKAVSYLNTQARKSLERFNELKAENEKLKERIGKFGNCLQWIKSGVCGMFGSPSKSWEEEVQDLVPEAIDKVMSEEEWEGIVSCEALRLRDKLDTLAKQNEELKSRSAKLVKALKEAKEHFDAIQSGLTTDINRVEFETKKRAHAAWVEVFNTLADAETFTTDVDNKFITDVDNEKPELTKPSKE